jgi:hypothetical protein
MSGTAQLNDVSCYDLTWAANVVRRSWQDLHDAFAAEGKAKLLKELKRFVAGGLKTPPNQEDVAARLGVPIATLRTWISRLRQRYRFFARRSGTHRFCRDEASGQVVP